MTQLKPSDFRKLALAMEQAAASRGRVVVVDWNEQRIETLPPQKEPVDGLGKVRMG